MHQLFSAPVAEVKTPDGKAMKGLFGDELEKKEKEVDAMLTFY